MVDVYFCTNRNLISTSMPNNFGTDFNQSSAMVTFGRARVMDIAREGDLSDANIAVDDLSRTAFSDDIRNAILDGPDHILISIHGFDYRFREVAMRSAWLADWFGQGAPAVQATVIFFSWPSLGSLTSAAYAADWQSASASGGAFRLFFQAIRPILEEARRSNSQRRINLMAHSMGNHALTAGLQATIGTAPGQYPGGGPPLFDRLLLIAADEDADALSRPDKLACTQSLAERIYVYYNNQDLPLLTFSRAFHGTSRLGIDGPPDKPSFRGLNYSFINCSAANPNDNDDPVDPQRHQYYRLIPEVRDDICGVLCCGSDDRLVNRVYREERNYYRLDCAPRERSERWFP